MKFVKKTIDLFKNNLHLLILLAIVYLGIYIRLSTADIEIMLDYDPWWYYRHTKYLLDNNFQLVKWDLLSFSPPGRPMMDPFGWEYIVAISYKMFSFFFSIDFMKFGIWSPAIISGLIAVPAYLTGKIITNKWGGLVTALFSVLTPTLIGVSMAGYMDTDALVVFFTFASTFSILYALQKRTIFSYTLSIFILWFFAFSWAQSWYILYMLVLFLIVYFVGSVILSLFSPNKKSSFLGIIKENFKKFKPYFLTLIIIFVGSSLLAIISGRPDPITTLSNAFDWLLGGLMIVNVSIAELQPINIFTQGGFHAVAARTGMSIYFAIFLPIIIIIKYLKKQKITLGELFAFLWLAATFYLIIHGVRFSLLFAAATSAAAGFVVGNLVDLTHNLNPPKAITATIFGLIGLFLLMEISNGLQIGNAMIGMEVSGNWVDMLDWLKNNADEDAIVSTWWDPGHIITGYTGLRVMADGAHCPRQHCIPYDHNIRIQNMGRIMSTDDESEAIDILKKYMGLTPEQCEEIKQSFGDIVPEEACEPNSEMYFISSNDLIGKFTWMNYFGGYRAPIKSGADFQKNPGVCCAATPKSEADQIPCGEFADQGKGVWVWCPWIFSLKDMKQDDQGNPIYIYDYSGLTISLVQQQNYLLPVYNNQYLINHLTFFSDNEMRDIDLSDSSIDLERIDGLVWVDPSLRNLIYFAPTIKDSVFTKTFFYDGRGLEHFELVYSNPEIKLYKVNFD